MEATVKDFSGQIAEIYRALPELSFLTDRDDEIFSRLFALCAVLALARVAELRKCAKKLCNGKASDIVDDLLPLRMLADLVRLWPEGTSHWATGKALAELKVERESPRSSDVVLNPRRLARMLRPFDVFSRDVRTGSGTRKGYLFEEVKAASSRYITPESATAATTRENRGENWIFLPAAKICCRASKSGLQPPKYWIVAVSQIKRRKEATWT